MPDPTDDLWPANFLVGVEPSPPVNLLKRQAEILAGKTDRCVEGVVRESVVGGTLYHSLYLKAPALGDYMFKILLISYPITRGSMDPFPVTVEDTFSGEPTEVGDMNSFTVWLKSVLTSEKVMTVVGNLIRRSKAPVAS